MKTSRIVVVFINQPLSSLYRPTLVLGLIWQLIKAQLLSGISLKAVPELIALLNCESGEDLKTFLKMPGEQILLRWVNYHVRKSGLSARTASNFGSDIAVSLTILSTDLSLQILTMLSDLAPVIPRVRIVRYLDL